MTATVSRKSKPKAAPRKKHPCPVNSDSDDAQVIASNDLSPEAYGLLTDSQMITRPVLSNIHEALSNTWEINTKLLMHFIFDLVAPYMEYKRGEVYAEGKDFPEHGDKLPDELTDEQGPNPGWMPYMPREYRYGILPYLSSDLHTYPISQVELQHPM